MANTPAVVSQQVPPPVIDLTLSPLVSPTTAIGDAPSTADLRPPLGQLTSYSQNWFYTANELTTDSGGSGDTDSGMEFTITCAAGTFNGVSPGYGINQRFLVPPSGTLYAPTPINTQMVRFEVYGVRFETTPSGTQCGQDSIVCFTGGGAGNGPIWDKSHTAGQSVGFGIIYDTGTSELRFVAKQVSGNTNPLTANVALGNPSNGITNPFYLDFRFFAASKSAPASLTILLDGVILDLGTAQSSWAAGTTLPQCGSPLSSQPSFIPVICNNTPTSDTANPKLHFTGARLRIGSVLACTLENQS